MSKSTNLEVRSSILISSTKDKIWDVLTNPNKIRVYMYGSNVETDWHVDSPILFKRNRIHESAPVSDKPVIDKGVILDVQPQRFLKFSFYNSMEGYEDLPENYSIISYSIDEIDNAQIKLTYLREFIPNEIEKMNQERFMPGMMKQIKSLAES